jgi:hypothetical protein
MKKFIIIFYSLLFLIVNSAEAKKLMFDPSPDSRVVGYKLYYGADELAFETEVDLKKNTYYDLPPLIFGKTYYFAATAYDNYGNESVFSEVLEYSVPKYIFDSSILCENWTYGDIYEWDLKAVYPREEFIAGGSACLLTKIKDVFVDHRWKTEFFRNGVLFYTDESSWQIVGSGWAYSSAIPVIYNIKPGSYVVINWIDEGGGYKKLAEKSFIVAESSLSNYFAGSIICDDWAYGDPDPWNFQPINPRTEYTQGDQVCSLSKVENIINDHRWKTEFFHNGVLAEYEETEWRYVGTGWKYSFAHPILKNAQIGTYEVKVWLDKGSGYELKSANAFNVNSPLAQALPYEEYFSNDQHGFVLENNNGHGSMYEDIIDGRDSLVIENGAIGQQWHVQAKKIGFAIKSGSKYVHQISLKADQPGKIYIAMQRDVDPWENFGLWHEVSVTTDWQTYTMEFTALGSFNPEDVRYAIQTGQLAGKVYIDEVKIYLP